MYTQTYNLPLLHQNQSMKELVINEALNKLDSLLNKSIKKVCNELPNQPEQNMLVLIAADARDTLKNHANHLALFLNDEWHFITPYDGMIFFNFEIKKFIFFSNNAWNQL
jgi:hypothetical protein